MHFYVRKPDKNLIISDNNISLTLANYFSKYLKSEHNRDGNKVILPIGSFV